MCRCWGWFKLKCLCRGSPMKTQVNICILHNMQVLRLMQAQMHKCKFAGVPNKDACEYMYTSQHAGAEVFSSTDLCICRCGNLKWKWISNVFWARMHVQLWERKPHYMYNAELLTLMFCEEGRRPMYRCRCWCNAMKFTEFKWLHMHCVALST